MAKQSRAKKRAKKRPINPDAQGALLLAAGFLGLLSLLSFTFLDPPSNWLGFVGYIAALGAEYLFGLAAYLIPLYLIWLGTRLIATSRLPHIGYDHLYFLILLCSCSFLLTIFAERFPSYAMQWENRVVSETLTLSFPYPRTLTRYNLGGAPFYFLFTDIPVINFQRILSTAGCLLIFSSLSLVSFLLLTRVRIFSKLQLLGRLLSAFGRMLIRLWKMVPREPIKRPSRLASRQPKINISEEKKKQTLEDVEIPRKVILSRKKELPPVPTKNLIVRADSRFQLPPPDLLSIPQPKVDQPTLKKDLMHQAAILEETLRSFGIEAKVGEINSGPTITSFEVHPSIGVKVQKIKALENDIALNMQAKSIRIVAPIPGKAAVGVEVPAIHPQEVSFKELLLHYQQKARRMQIPLLLGKAVNGDWVFSDLVRTPHLLIAGATGSGKSVCINTIVMSILMNARPDEIKLLMVDPKKVELTQYSQLPHMIAPVITEPHGAYAALQWLVKEMQVRYEILKQLGLRNITAFNNRKINKDFEASLNISIPEQMPLIVAIIDEFADLMMVSSADIETPIARIAQMARAVGIHLILATQRPSREVITGIIKANIPTRISFKVASRINSQIILDEVGAESLLGNGDLLFLPPGTSSLMRAQGAYVSDEEINKTIEFLARQSPPEYLIPSFDTYRTPDLGGDESQGKDALYDQALNIVLASKSASTTYLQRKLKIGYARAASLMDELETNGVIGPQEGAKPRRVLGSLSAQSALLEDDSS